MKIFISLLLVTSITFFVGCNPADNEVEIANEQMMQMPNDEDHGDVLDISLLPRGVSEVELDDLFDTEGDNVHTFINAGSLAYFYNDVDNDRPISVDIDNEGFITRLSWHFLVEGTEGLKEAVEEVKEHFGAHLIEQSETDGVIHLYFDDKVSSYRVTFVGNTVTIVLRDTEQILEE